MGASCILWCKVTGSVCHEQLMCISSLAAPYIEDWVKTADRCETHTWCAQLLNKLLIRWRKVVNICNVSPSFLGQNHLRKTWTWFLGKLYRGMHRGLGNVSITEEGIAEFSQNPFLKMCLFRRIVASAIVIMLEVPCTDTTGGKFIH